MANHQDDKIDKKKRSGLIKRDVYIKINTVLSQLFNKKSLEEHLFKNKQPIL